MIVPAGSTVSFRISSGGLHDRVIFAEIGKRLALQYARTVRGETKIPSFTESSAAMRSSPQVGYSRSMRP